MLAGIKKVLGTLGVLCVIVIVFEAVNQSTTTTNRVSDYTELWVSDMRENTDSLLFNASTTLHNEFTNYLRITDSTQADEIVEDKEKNDLSNSQTDTQQGHNTRIFYAPKPESVMKKEKIISEDFQDEVKVDSQNGVLDEDNNELDTDEEARLRLSPYIYFEDKEMEKLSTPPVQGAVKLVSHFLPWDLSRNFLKRFRQCRYYKCEYTNNMSDADAIVFRASLVREHLIPDFYRPKHQRWILYTGDPAVKKYALDRTDVGSKFNWTMTYQLHADYPKIFGRLRRVSALTRDFEAIYTKKDRWVAWFVSHCPTWSKRELYVERMKQIIPVHVFGKCGNMTCGPIHYRVNDSTECLPMLTNHYKFYLSFENSFCKDYVSEKFFKLFENNVDVVPVVRGGFNYKKYMPSGIFVDTLDFQTPEDLAHYLIKLGNDKETYTNMLRRKNRWGHIEPQPLHCLVCEALHTAGPEKKYYSNLMTKFNGDPPDCWVARDLRNNERNL